MLNRTVRNLAHLEKGRSTGRVLNLLSVYRRHQADAEYKAATFFANAALNRCILIKHQLRPEEKVLFPDRKVAATKIIIPIDSMDLRLGGRYAFVGERYWRQMLSDYLGDCAPRNERDFDLLRAIDDLPTLDPFLLRERLRRRGFSPARCYFDVSDGDLLSMAEFVEREIEKLVELCYADEIVAADQKQAARLAEKILWSSVDDDSELLRTTLRMNPEDYQEGVFCWKGFLYYKWTMQDSLARARRVAEAVLTIGARGDLAPNRAAELQSSRAALHGEILQCLSAVGAAMRFYDAAYASLLRGSPREFREFLLRAPDMFVDLGERVGVIRHIVSYWSYRFPSGRLPVIRGEELVDLVAGFRASLAFSGRRELSPAV